MQISRQQMASKPKKVGKLNGKDVFHLPLKGGLHMIVGASEKAAGFETLGTGPHPAVARHIAMKKQPDIMWTELNKADYVEPEHYQHLLPKYEAMTDAIRRRNGDE